GAVSEGEPVDPNSEYAVAKAAATSYGRLLARKHGMPVVTLRLYSVYGPYEDPRRLMPSLITHGLRNELPPLVDPRSAHDFVHVDDVVEAFVLAAGRQDGEPGAIYNVGTGQQTSLADLVDVARQVLHIDAEPRWGSARSRPWDTTSWVADNRKIARELGWHPRVRLRDGFEQMVQWLLATPEVWSSYGVEGRPPLARSARAAPEGIPSSDKEGR
ncbi:MAG: GDP-mannose 4,6-dehydratase, partial [Actinomycetota bacterium]|nr:GDP-mannose 4,6-dehydratase [Actinomycetota bacterium]